MAIIPILMCSCPQLEPKTKNELANELNQLVILAIRTLVLSIMKMVHNKLFNTVQEKDLKQFMLETRQLSGVTVLPNRILWVGSGQGFCENWFNLW